MKTIRRLTVEIEKRKLLIDRRGADTASKSAMTEKPNGNCPDCGSAWVLVNDAGTAQQEGQSADLQTFHSPHLHVSPSGHLWICQESLQKLTTRNSKEHL